MKGVLYSVRWSHQCQWQQPAWASLVELVTSRQCVHRESHITPCNGSMGCSARTGLQVQLDPHEDGREVMRTNMGIRCKATVCRSLKQLRVQVGYSITRTIKPNHSGCSNQTPSVVGWQNSPTRPSQEVPPLPPVGQQDQQQLCWGQHWLTGTECKPSACQTLAARPQGVAALIVFIESLTRCMARRHIQPGKQERMGSRGMIRLTEMLGNSDPHWASHGGC